MSSSKTKFELKSPDLRRRRRHPRYRGEFRAMVSHLRGDKYHTVEGHCRDLSEGGLGLLVAADLEGGDVVNLNFSLPGSNVPWDVRAVVRFRRGYQYGFEFLALPKDYRESLQAFLSAREPVD